MHTKTGTHTHKWAQTLKLRQMQIKFFSFLDLTQWKAQGPSKSAQIQNLSGYNEKQKIQMCNHKIMAYHTLLF